MSISPCVTLLKLHFQVNELEIYNPSRAKVTSSWPQRLTKTWCVLEGSYHVVTAWIMTKDWLWFAQRFDRVIWRCRFPTWNKSQCPSLWGQAAILCPRSKLTWRSLGMGVSTWKEYGGVPEKAGQLTRPREGTEKHPVIRDKPVPAECFRTIDISIVRTNIWSYVLKYIYTLTNVFPCKITSLLSGEHYIGILIPKLPDQWSIIEHGPRTSNLLFLKL